MRIFKIFLLSLPILFNACSEEGSPCIGCEGSGTGAVNEVILTLEDTDIATFNIGSFTQDIAGATGAGLDQIVITSVNGFNRSGVYVSFYFEDSDTDGLSAIECLSAIQNELADGTIGDYTATIIITNTDDSFVCEFDEDCAGICNGDTTVSNCGVCAGADNTPNEGSCDCGGEPNGEGELDDCGQCNGDNEDMDICGECFGNGSSCDLGAIADVYYLKKVECYQTADCSGSPIATLNGPELSFNDDDSYYNDECSWYEGTYESTVSYYLDLAANGTYGFLAFDSDIEDWDECYDWGSCSDDDECPSCTSWVQNTSEVEIEVGEWEIYNNNLDFVYDYAKEFMTGTVSYTSSECGDESSEEVEFDGCLDFSTENYSGYSYEGGSYLLDGNPSSYELSGSTLTMQFKDYDDYYYYYYDDDYECQCVEYEWRTTSSFPSVQGCTDENSDLYNPFATSDDGSCNEGDCYFYYYSAQNPPVVEEKKSIFFNSNDRRPRPNERIPKKQR